MEQIEYGIGNKITYYLKEVDNLVNDKYQPFVTCEIDPTNRCQLKCKWCIYAEMRNDNPVDLGMGTYKNMIMQLYGVGCKSITFTGGGEPLLHPRIGDMIQFAFIHHIKMGVVTNGVALHKIKDYLNHLDFVRVSLDCATSERFQELKSSDKFQNVCHNIREVVKSSKCDVGLSMVHTNENRDQINEFINLGKQLNVDYVQVKAAWQPNNIEEQTKKMLHPEAFVTERYTVLPKLSAGSKYLPCVIAGLIGQLGADGILYYCCVHRGKSAWSLANMNYPMSLKSVIKRRANMIVDLSKCGSCRYVNYAKVYNKVADKKYTMLRHKAFI